MDETPVLNGSWRRESQNWSGRPAHLTQSAEESSLDAWLEGYAYYRRPERSISYYNKGELLGIMLDLAVREASHGQASLREVFQWMNQNYAKKGRFFPDSEGVREAAEAVSHADLGWFFSKYVAGTEEIPWDDFFRTVGLRLVVGNKHGGRCGIHRLAKFRWPHDGGSGHCGQRSRARRPASRRHDSGNQRQGRRAGIFGRNSAGLSAWRFDHRRVRGRRGGERELKWKVGSREEITYELKDMDKLQRNSARAGRRG